MRRVKQIQAKRGIFISSCQTPEEFQELTSSLEIKYRSLMAINNKELVYTILPVYSKIDGRKVMHQIFLIDK